MDTNGYEYIGKATMLSLTCKESKGIARPGDATGWWQWSSGEVVPATPGTATDLEQIDGAKALVFIDRNNGFVYRKEGK